MRVAFALALVVLLDVTVSALAADTTIVPGQGIGPVRLGDSLVDLVKVMGYPKTTGLIGSKDGVTRYRWYDVTFTSETTSAGGGGLFVEATANGTITKVGVFLASQYRLENGLHTRDRQTNDGSHEAEVVRLMGPPQSTTSLRGLRRLVYSGVTFWLDTSGSVTQIDVVKEGL